MTMTWLQGYVNTTYKKLVETFGEPTNFCGDKTTVEWELHREYAGRMYRVTIYDYKTGYTPSGPYDWHIGGTEPIVVDLIKRELNKEKYCKHTPVCDTVCFGINDMYTGKRISTTILTF